MRATVTGGAIGMDQVPDVIGSRQGLGRVDYVDVFTLHTTAAMDHSPEAWARAVLEEGPSVRRFAFIPWRVLLGLRLGPSYAPGYVHGWKITGIGDDWIRLEAASWLMACNAVAHVEDGQVSVALFVRYDHPVTALWWGVLSAYHRRGMPVILNQGLKVLTTRTPTTADRPAGASR